MGTRTHVNVHPHARVHARPEDLGTPDLSSSLSGVPQGLPMSSYFRLLKGVTFLFFF